MADVDQPRPVGDDEPPQEPGREEVGHALRGVQEVEGVPGRRGVHHDEVVVALGVDLVQPLHGDVVVTLHEPSRDVLVQRVGQDLVPGPGIGRVPADEGVPRLLGVEHRRPQLSPRLEPGSAEGLVGDAMLGIADPFETEGIGQPLGRVDGEDQHLAPVAQRGHQRGGGCGGCLADPTGPAGDGDLLGGEQAVHRPAARRGGLRPVRRSPCVGARSGVSPVAGATGSGRGHQ